MRATHPPVPAHGEPERERIADYGLQLSDADAAGEVAAGRGRPRPRPGLFPCPFRTSSAPSPVPFPTRQRTAIGQQPPQFLVPRSPLERVRGSSGTARCRGAGWSRRPAARRSSSARQPCSPSRWRGWTCSFALLLGDFFRLLDQRHGPTGLTAEAVGFARALSVHAWSPWSFRRGGRSSPSGKRARSSSMINW